MSALDMMEWAESTRRRYDYPVEGRAFNDEFLTLLSPTQPSERKLVGARALRLKINMHIMLRALVDRAILRTDVISGSLGVGCGH